MNQRHSEICVLILHSLDISIKFELPFEKWVILNVYGKINTKIISSKLGVGISNLPGNWVSGLCDEMKEEILLREHNLAVWKRVGIKTSGIKQYNPEEIVNLAHWNEEAKNIENDYLKVIAENLICIQVLDFDNSLLKLKNDTLDSPSCEKEYVRRFLRFCDMMQNSRSAREYITLSNTICNL